MKRFRFGYFLSVCIFLLSGFNQLYAHSLQVSINYPVSQLIENTESRSLELTQKSLSFTNKSIISDRQEFETDLEEEDETEREQLCLKKILVSSNLFTAVFYAQPSNCFSHSVKAKQSYCSGGLSIASVKPYVKFQIFRI